MTHKFRCRAKILVAGMICIMACASAARGDENVQQAVAALTTGAWHVDGAEAGRMMEFKQDESFIQGTVEASGTFEKLDGFGGVWSVSGSGVTLSYWQWPSRHETYSLPIDPAAAKGVDENGHAVKMTRQKAPPMDLPRAGRRKRDGTRTATGNASAAPAATPAFPPEMEARGRAAVKKYRNSLVFVTGSNGAGSGFIATDGKSNYLITNVHVEAALADADFKTLDGVSVTGGTASMAVGEDLLRMQYPKGGTRLGLMNDVETNVTIGDQVVVLGNAEGAGVINTLYGKVVGLGPNLVEVDAPFVPGNSGSPVIHLKTGKVIGVATYARFGFFGIFFGGETKVRRFAYRLDSVKTWQPVDLPVFRKQAVTINDLGKRTGELESAMMNIEYNFGGVKDGNLAKPIQEWKKWKGKRWNGKQKSESSRALVKAFHEECTGDIQAAEGSLTYDFFKQELEKIKRVRDEMDKRAGEVVGDTGK